MKKFRGVVAAAAASALALTGCGAGGASDDPVKSAEAFLAGLVDGDVAAVCEVSAYLSEEYDGPVDPQQWTQSECETEVWEEYEDHFNKPVYDGVEVGEANIAGNVAEIPPENLNGWPEDNSYGLRLQLFDGYWYVTNAMGS